MELNYWTQKLRSLYDLAIEKYRAGEREADTFFDNDATGFLSSIGLRSIHVYDFAEDFCGREEPDWETFLLIVAARRDYFIHEMQQNWPALSIQETDLPSKDDTEAGVEWLPRIIPKAQAFLEGALPPELMYCCGGDRKFFKNNRIHPADFLRIIWAAKGDKDKIVDFVRASGETRL